jgi:hypothetical protein
MEINSLGRTCGIYKGIFVERFSDRVYPVRPREPTPQGGILSSQTREYEIMTEATLNFLSSETAPDPLSLCVWGNSWRVGGGQQLQEVGRRQTVHRERESGAV